MTAINILKASYQKNLAMGMLTASCLAFAAAIIIHLSKEETVVIKTPDKMMITDHFSGTESDYPLANIAGWNNKLPAYPIQISGRPIPVSGIFSQFGNESVNYPELYFAVGEPVGNDILYGTFGSAGPFPNDSWPENEDPLEFVTNKPIRIADYGNKFIFDRKKDWPLMIQLKIPRYPSGLYVDVDATVTLGMTLNSKGFITDWLVYYEEPSGKGFALALKEALRDSYIKAEIKNGLAVGGHYIITYDFCKKCPDKPVVIKSPENVIVSF